ncbi:winged helix-turn-helix transcriptional regulator [Micromonospora sp. NBC_01813]|uniref:winged helix-turn-helix transcriptional regulator n=1 Tax=Micromonospora sp. NBC_01813 TaxID=2975988 RepID=UPI002DDAD180|nr:winged helix-turn-helix transcriptional regulator [Micromonospora sp. NBC_01813]WSA06955.1 winged helix-turn-helix transcriptional regulator [Micromonospora sp. NBC_01813]
MEYDDLAKIDNLAHNLWDAAALFCLEHKSLRYTELGREMAAWSGRYLSESELTRTRHRLVRRKMISPGPGANGHNVYTITQAGRARLAQIRVIIQIAPRLDQPDGDTADDGKPDDEG